MSEFSFMDGGLEAQQQNGQAHGHVQVQQNQQAPSGNASSTAAYNAGIKLSDLFQGFKVTINGMVALFFIGYAAWLFVIYWVRHNEPLADHVLGTPTAGAPTSHADRIIVGGAKFALPIAAPQGGFFTPGVNKSQKIPDSLPTMGDPSSFSAQSQIARVGGNTPQDLAAPGSAAYGQSNNHSRVVQFGRERIVVAHPEPLPGSQDTQAPYTPSHPMAQQATSNFAGGGSNYHMPVQSHDGMRLKTVVNR